MYMKTENNILGKKIAEKKKPQQTTNSSNIIVKIIEWLTKMIERLIKVIECPGAHIHM